MEAGEEKTSSKKLEEEDEEVEEGKEGEENGRKR